MFDIVASSSDDSVDVIHKSIVCVYKELWAARRIQKCVMVGMKFELGNGRVSNFMTTMLEQ